MTPQIVHRYAWPIRDAIEHLLGEAAGDCEAWRIRIEGEELVIDVVAPAAREVVAAPSIETPAEPQPEEPAKPERKGGKLAQTAGIICAERGFWKFLAEKYDARIETADAAAEWLRAQCGVASRADLDHEPLKAETFRDVEKAYRFWLDGY
ncbi:hypothetical protein C8D77_101281 [Mesorhizobium loti]|uniref:Uncharacterized protein n=1 Tax=Rhizobium loti TaxID=381 RepID=A0A8E2WGN1_RHILI|nr:hypothetical protein [Mesorhizobium loti]PWJ93602.1 hypothetical protein C8D77_101281 [Mesorhizobium loti]